MNSINVWVDDNRDPIQWRRKNFVWAKSANGAVKLLKSYDVNIISLDCDLSPNQYLFSGLNKDNITPSGLDLIEWMIKFNKIPPYVEVHSANEQARNKMINLLQHHIEDSRILLYIPTKIF